MIWSQCNGTQAIHTIRGTLHRLVESQQAIATLDYVDTLEEQAVLESLLEGSKPAWPPDSGRHHYLLRTPFRYPPLTWGSRFGHADEPSLLYGGLSTHTTLAEAAYYRFVFFLSMAQPAPKAAIHSQHTLFTTGYRTPQGIQLQFPPFASHAAQLAHRSDYRETQALGTDMRAAGVLAFEYPSARDTKPGLCVGLFSIQALADTKPRTQRAWLCQTSAHDVTFKPENGPEIISFHLADFLLDGILPRPA
ncbi:MAG: RES domain-containing protein [Castellaniella sp.]|uniref:RES family NAD+ phosphorylase n=1 Tax=Castellaniella sp. TaxID=1955812 RepID=UPI00120D9276|nr:RES family NAD+ phosphorylase [Castellaniella sp.]TAN28032.1 MAG: RES domain-containing protein [Castellaniella sp.]